VKVEVFPGRRYVSGVSVPGPAFLADQVIGTELLKSDSLGWTNAIAYRKGEDPLSLPGEHSHVIYATRSGPREIIDTDDPKFGGLLLWLKEAYPDMPMPGQEPSMPGSAVPVSTSTMVVAAGGIAILGFLGVLFLSNYARLPKWPS